MVYDFGGKSHSSPSFSVSRSRNPYYSEAQREEDRKKKQEERAKLEDKVASSRLDIPPSVQKKHPQASKQLWREFRRTIYAHHGKDTVFALDGAIQTNSNSLSLGELVGSGLSMETASQIYSKWDEYWSYTSDIIQNHPLVPNSYPSSESLAEIEQKYIKEEIKEKEDYKVATQKLRESALELYESGNYQVAYAQFQTVTKNAEYFYWNRNSLELNLAKCAIEIGKTEKAKFLADELVKKGYEVGQSNYIRGRAEEIQGSMLNAFQRYESALNAGYSEAKADYERVERILFPESTMSLDEYKMYMAKGGKAIFEGRAVEVVLPAMTLSIPPSVEQADLSGFDESVSQKKDKEQKTTLEIGVNQKENTKDSKDSKVAPEETTKIVNTSDTGVAVPGTKITYGLDLGDRIEPRDYFTYKWRIKNDLSKVNENSGIFSAKRHPMFVDLGVSKKGKVDVEWDFPGNHTIEVEVYNQGSLESSHSIKQVVQDAEQHAKDAFSDSAPPVMQGDVYLTWLSTQRELAASQGQEAQELRQIERAIANATELLGVSNDNPSGEAIPISATLVPKANPQPAPLQLYLKAIKDGIEIVDLTSPTDARTYSGLVRTTGRQADRVDGKAEKGSLEAAAVPFGNVESPEAIAIERAWNNFLTNNPHPAGEVVAQLTGNAMGLENQTLTGESDGVSTLGKVSNWFSSIGLVAGLGGLAFTVATGGVGTVAVGLFMASYASGVVAGGSNIADRVKHGNFKWDGETALDLVDIAGGLAGGTTAILSLGGKAAGVAKIRNAVMIGETIETGTDVAGGVILGAQYLSAIEEIKSNPDLSEQQKQEQIAQILAAAAATGGLMVLGAAAGVGTKKGADVDADVDAPSTNRPADTVERTTKETITTTTTAQTTETTTPNIFELSPQSPLVRALPSDLQGKVKIVVDESLNGGTVRAYYKPDLHIKVGTKASVADIQLHVPTVRTLAKYQGLTGKVRALIERIANWIKRNGEPPVFSRAWSAKLELQKLPAIIEARQARLASGDIDADTRTQLEIEIADLESQITRHARTLDEMDTNPGVGYVAAEGVSKQDIAYFQEIDQNLIDEGGITGFIKSTKVSTQMIVEIHSSVKKVAGNNKAIAIDLTTGLLKEIKKQNIETPAQVRQLTTSLLDPQSNWVARQTTQVNSRTRTLNEAEEIGLPSLKDEVTQQERSLYLKQHEVEALKKEVRIPQSQWSQYDLTSKDINRKNDRIHELKKEISQLKIDISQQQGQIDSLQTERSRERRIIHDEKLRQQKKEADIRRQRAIELRQQNTFAGNVTAEHAWQRLIATSSDDTSSALWASVLIEQGIISNKSEIIAYLNTIKIQGQPVKKVRQQFKNYYRPKLFKIINSQSTPELRYQKMRDIAESLDIREQGEFSEQWYLPRYGKRRDPFSSKPIENSTQVTLDKTKAEQEYGIELTTEKNRRFDEVYGDENSATIREHKHIKGKLGAEQIAQFDDNIKIVQHNFDIDTKTSQGIPLTKSKQDNPLIIEKDGKRFRPKKLMYTFATPEGVKANAKWMNTELKNNDKYLSFEIINSKGERKIVKQKNIKELQEPALSLWLYP